jgi:histidyl-tRNA synthetase
MFPPSLSEAAVDVVVTFLDDESRADALNLASELRQRSLRVDVYPEASRKFDKPLKYAAGRGAKAMGIFGANERATGEASVRNLQTREQTAVPRSEAAGFIAQLVNR